MQVGDRVKPVRGSGEGTIIAIHHNAAWITLDGTTTPVTYFLSNLKVMPPDTIQWVNFFETREGAKYLHGRPYGTQEAAQREAQGSLTSNYYRGQIELNLTKRTAVWHDAT